MKIVVVQTQQKIPHRVNRSWELEMSWWGTCEDVSLLKFKKFELQENGIVAVNQSLLLGEGGGEAAVQGCS